MTILREAAQQALEALELGYDSAKAEADQYHAAMAGYRPQRHAEMDAEVQKIAAAITALKAALAEEALQRLTDVSQEIEAALAEDVVTHGSAWSKDGKRIDPMSVYAEPVQEPVAWRWGYRSITTGEMDWRGYVEIAADPNLRSPAIIMEPLYTAPPQRKPLSKEEIKECERQAMVNGSLPFEQRVFFARAIERAHGIK